MREHFLHDSVLIASCFQLDCNISSLRMYETLLKCQQMAQMKNVSKAMFGFTQVIRTAVEIQNTANELVVHLAQNG